MRALRYWTAVTVVTLLASCASAPANGGGEIPLRQRAEALTATINMRRQLFGAGSIANRCDVYRLLGRAPNYRELIREDARRFVAAGDVGACDLPGATGGSWRIVSIRRDGRALVVRVSTSVDSEGWYEEYRTFGFGAAEVRVFSFTYD